jgi:hypothetical protein
MESRSDKPISTQHQIPHLPPPSTHPVISNEDHWNFSKDGICDTVFGLAWFNDYLVGCTASGSILVWRIPNVKSADFPESDLRERESYSFERSDSDDEFESLSKRQKGIQGSESKFSIPGTGENRHPIVNFKASKGVLYSIGFLHQPISLILGVCGDDGILLFSWSDIKSLVDDPSFEVTPLSQYRPHKSKTVVEINDFVLDEDLCLYGASGDAFGCYKWDTESETLLKTFESPKGGYLHTVQTLPSSTTPGGHSLLLIGGEDGILGVWDRMHDKLIENIDIKFAMNSNVSLMRSTFKKPGFQKWEDSANLWTSYIHASPESSNWWHVCGGAEKYGHSDEASGGYITSFHAPTRTIASGCATRESLNHMSSTLSSTCAASSSSLVTVANEGVVSYWSPTRIERTQRVWCTTPCGYAISVRTEDGWIAVGGVGNTIDIMESQGTKVYSVLLL